MLVILSPAKKQDHTQESYDFKVTQAQEKCQSAILVDELKKLTVNKIKSVMSVSDKIAKLNYERFQDFDPITYDQNNSKPAIFAFQGDAYKLLQANTLSNDDLKYAQDHLLILSGLYGYLRPFDLIQPYRLEMKTVLNNPHGADLYEFWGDRISKGLNKALKKSKSDAIINLASGEYFKAIDQSKIAEKIITIHFKNYKNGQHKVIGINAKRARGAMARYIIQNKIVDIKMLLKFKELGFMYNKTLSNGNDIVFSSDN